MSYKAIALLSSVLLLNACQSTSQIETTPPLIGSWHIEIIGEHPVIDYSPANITFGEDGQLSGNNSCNNFFGQYSQTENQLTLTPAGSTMKACVEALMKQEQRVMVAMPKVTQAKMLKGKLILSDQQGQTQLVLTQL